MRSLTAMALALSAAIVAAVPAHATISLLAIGSLTGSSAGAGVDLSGLTYDLENGQTQNVLGGIGSGLAWAGGTTFYATPDRGPNALSYNAAVDNTTSYISRFQTLDLQLTPSSGGALPFTLGATLTNTTLLSSSKPLIYGSGAGLGNDINGNPLLPGNWVNGTPGTYYFTGRSDNFGAGGSGNPNDARFDPESIRVSNDGKSVFVSDEYGPYVRQFDASTGSLVRTYALPADLDVANPGTTEDGEIAGNTAGRIANKGMEGLALTPDGKTLVGIMQANLLQDPVGTLRIVTVDVATGATHEYLYQLTDGKGVSDIVAIDATHFLVDERDGKGLGDGSSAKAKSLYAIDLSGATDVTGADAAGIAAATPVTKSLKLDLVAALKAAGYKASEIPAKIESLAFGEDVTDSLGHVLHTLYIANDNDFDTATSGQNQFFVFGFTDADLPGFTAQVFGGVPEPESWALLIVGVGGIGVTLRLRRRQQFA